MSLAGIMAHRAVRVRMEVTGPMIEGEREEVVVEGEPFPCVLFPAGTREAGRSGRRSEQPMMLITGLDVVGGDTDLRPEDRVRFTALPGLTDEDVGEYQVDGQPMPLGRPGSVPRGYQVNLRRIST